MGILGKLTVRSIKLKEWPLADQLAWMAACKPGGRLSRGGAASHLKEVTQKDLVNRYGLFLGYVFRIERVVPDSSPAALVTPDRVAGFVKELQARVASVTVGSSIYKLRRAAEIINPELDLCWLHELENDLAMEMIPANKFERIVGAEEIVRAGLSLMEEADCNFQLSPYKRARLYRNGLMIALLALCPVRLKNFSGLTLGKNFVNFDGSWWIDLSANETKERKPDERSIPKFLASSIDHYISTYRPVFKYLGKQLWAGSEGQPLGYSGVAVVITETTRQTLGIPISPHLFRSCAACTATKHGSKTPNLGSAILNHRDPTIVEKHYNRSRSSYYAREFGNIIDHLES